MIDDVRSEPLLGLATTRELLEELAARMVIELASIPVGRFNGSRAAMENLAWECQRALRQLPRSALEYRTVDS